MEEKLKLKAIHAENLSELVKYANNVGITNETFVGIYKTENDYVLIYWG